MNDQSPVERIICNIDMYFASEKSAAEALHLLRSSLECTLSKNGCVDCRALMDSSDAVNIHYLEQWATETAFQKHVVSSDFKHVFFAMDMCCEAPGVEIERVVSQSGMDYLRTVYDEGVGLVTDQWQVSETEPRNIINNGKV